MNHYMLFEGLKEAEVNDLLKSACEEKAAAGRTVIREGEIVPALYILKSGSAEVKKLIDKKEEIICTLDSGDFFGETVVADEKKTSKASASVAAAEDSVILHFDREHISRMMRTYPQITWNMAQELSKRLSISNDTLKRQIEIDHKSSRKEITRLNALIEATQTVNSSLEIDRVLQLILDEAMQITDAERGTIYLLDENTNEIWSRSIVGGMVNEIRQPVGKGISGYVAETGETVNSNDAYNDPRFNPEFDMKTGFRTKNILCAPMRNKDDKTIGVFQLINKRHDDFNSDDEKFLKAFSIHASIAIENSRLALEMVKNERLSAVGRMAGTIIHDIKNPMSIIRLYAQLLEKNAGNEEASTMVDAIIKQIDRLVNMAQEVLDFSRGVSQMNVQKVDYCEFMTGVLRFLQEDFEKRGIELHNENNYSGEIEMDADKITRVMLNIAGNAADAMPDGGKFYVRSNSKVEAQSANGGKSSCGNNYLTIELEDTGTGMTEEVKKKIFEPFFTCGKKHGTGLGMAIVKKIIDDHNGTIEIKSEIGKGTKFFVTLPISQKNP